MAPGVCTGIAVYTGIDLGSIRLGFILTTGVSAVLYVVLAIVSRSVASREAYLDALGEADLR